MSDQYWNHVVLLLHCDGIDGSSRIVDEKNHYATLFGDARISDIQKKFGSSSLRFDGNGDYMSFPASSDFNLQAKDFTAEAWCYPRATPNENPCVFSIGGFKSAAGLWVCVDDIAAPGKFSVFVGSVSQSSPVLESNSTVAYDQWAHISVVRNNASMMLFINGVLESTAPITGNVLDAASVFLLGGASPVGSQFFGYIDEVRLTLDVARYSANFPVQSSVFDHGELIADPHYSDVVFLCHFDGEQGASTFHDEKGNTINSDGAGGTPIVSNSADVCSAVFACGAAALNNTTGNYAFLKVVNNDFSFGQRDFTIELSLFFALIGGVSIAFRLMAMDGTNTVLEFGYDSASSRPFLRALGGLNYFGYGRSPSRVAIVRSGPYLTVYVNGSLALSVNIGAAEINSNGVLYIAGAPGSQNGIYGYLDEFRITNGVARYSSNYTPTGHRFPDFGPASLTGTVRDASGNPISRLVRSYRSSDGLLVDSVVSDSTTGAFSLRATDLSEHFVIVHDAEKNALIFDHVTPVEV